MSGPSFIFWLIFVVPLVIFLIWLMRQDKRKGGLGLIIVILTVAIAVIYMYVKTGGK